VLRRFPAGQRRATKFQGEKGVFFVFGLAGDLPCLSLFKGGIWREGGGNEPLRIGVAARQKPLGSGAGFFLGGLFFHLIRRFLRKTVVMGGRGDFKGHPPPARFGGGGVGLVQAFRLF